MTSSDFTRAGLHPAGPATAALLLLTLAAGCRPPWDVHGTSPERSFANLYNHRVVLAEDLAVESPETTAAGEVEALLSDGILTLKKARSVALAENPDIHAAIARLENAGARIAEVRAAFLPTLSFQHNSTRTFQTPPSRPRLQTAIQSVQQIPNIGSDPLEGVAPIFRPLLRPLFFPGQLQPNTSAFSDHSTAFSVTWTVFDGFVRDALLLASERLHRATKESLLDVERLLIQAVDVSYYQVQLAAEQIRIARADAAFSGEQLEETRKLSAAGRATQADVDNFRVRALAAQANLSAALRLRDTGRVVLAELMGIPTVTLPDGLVVAPLAEESEKEMATSQLEPLLQHGLAHRPDLRRVRAVLDSEEANVRAAKGLFSPAVGVSATWGFDRSSNIHYGSDDQSSGAGFEVRWDLYTGGSRRAKLRAARASYTEAVATLRRARLAVESQIRTAIIEVRDAQEQIRLQRENLTTAIESRRIVQAGYVAGKETLTRLNQAQRDYIEADVNLALARIRLRRGLTNLRAAAAETPTTP